MKKYFVWLMIAGFGAWLYNEYRKTKTQFNPKLK